MYVCMYVCMYVTLIDIDMKQVQPICFPETPSSNTNYFTSCDPHHDIYTFSYWQIFCIQLSWFIQVQSGIYPRLQIGFIWSISVKIGAPMDTEIGHVSC